MTSKKIKDLSIQVQLNGLSFCIRDDSSKRIEFNHSVSFDTNLTPFEVLNRLKDELSSNSVFSQDFNSVTVVHYNELATLVPQSLYNESLNAEYLKFNSKILKTDFIASDTISSKHMISVYVPYVNINNYIFDTFGEFAYLHASTVFINAVSNYITEEDNLFVNVNYQSMQLLLCKNQNIELYNYFEFDTPEDFIYYLLFTCEQKDLNPEHLQVNFVGNITSDSELFQMAYKYIRNVKILENSSHFLIEHSY